MNPRTGVASALVVGLSLVVVAQESIDRAMVAKIKEEGLQRSQAGKLFDTLVDDFGPRVTGSPAFKRSVDWTRQTLASWGLDSARVEPFEFGRGWTTEKLTLEMVEPRYMPLLGYADGWSPSTPGEVTAAPILIADKPIDQVEAMASQIKGAIVLSQPMVTNFIREDRVQPSLQPDAPPKPADPAQTGRGGGRGAGRGSAGDRLNQILAEAAAVIRPSRGEHGTVFVTGNRNADKGAARVLLAGEHYNMILRMLQRGIPVKLRVNVQTKYHDQDRNAYNVITEIPGTDPARRDEVVMLGAHLDSWHTGTGASDNADGVAASMEAFRILKVIGARPKRTLRLAIWGGEEQGLLGSRAYVERHLAGDGNKAARDKLYVYFNIDPGMGPIYGWYLEGNAAIKPIFDAWLEPLKDTGARKNVMAGIGNTDHLSFIRAGMPGFNPIQDYTDYDVRTHHTNVDTAERIKVSDIQQNAVILASFLYHAGIREGSLPRTKN